MKIKYFEIARKISKKSLYKHKIGAVLVRKNKIFGKGFNQTKTHPKSNNMFLMRHAEFNAVLNSKLDNLHGYEIYIYRETKSRGKLASAKPCIHCFSMLKTLGISKIYYSDYEGYKVA